MNWSMDISKEYILPIIIRKGEFVRLKKLSDQHKIKHSHLYQTRILRSKRFYKPIMDMAW